ncbi:uncharacterized protein LOC111047351 isoform X2 [Nilaparvata lugens]|uniref:uncharacterized protein LOC111047351 isoform X2 n=1 Tax=Nilaparvata lugens TaxID=108931 RepID=UPI00193CE8E1|nr:uncharacterized protein LOC111047351 isoform X2 [Nilaparvata lugens]
MKGSLGFSCLVCIVFLFSCLPMVVLQNNDPDKVYCDPKRRVWYDKNGKATMQMVPGNGRAVPGTNKVYEKLDTVELRKDTMAVCLMENGVTYDDYIRLINMELPQTSPGKCFLGCILYQNGIVNDNYELKTFVSSRLARALKGILKRVMRTFGSRFIFSGDTTIYENIININEYVDMAIEMAIKSLKEIETKKVEMDGLDKCERMNEYLKIASAQKEFPNYKKTSYKIRQRKLENKKQLVETPKPDPNPSNGKGKKQEANTRTAVKHSTYANYCAAAFPSEYRDITITD